MFSLKSISEWFSSCWSYFHTDSFKIKEEGDSSFTKCQEAALKGNTVAMKSLAHFWEERAQKTQNSHGGNHHCTEIWSQMHKAFSWYKKAAQSGDMEAMKKVEECYRKGMLCVDINKKEAAFWEREIKKVDALHYMEGRGLLKDTDWGMQLYREASDEGDGEASLKLGQIFAQGLYGIKKNLAEACKYYNRAEQQGNVQARYFLLNNPGFAR